VSVRASCEIRFLVVISEASLRRRPFIQLDAKSNAREVSKARASKTSATRYNRWLVHRAGPPAVALIFDAGLSAANCSSLTRASAGKIGCKQLVRCVKATRTSAGVNGTVCSASHKRR
jgi:hypothetical protein